MAPELTQLLNKIDQELKSGKHAINTSIYLREELIDACSSVEGCDVKDVALESIVRAISTMNKMLNHLEDTI